MTADPVRQLAQANPVPKLTDSWTQDVLVARELVDSLTSILRRIDKTTDSLAEHGLTVSTDLGPVGNAAASVRRDLEKQKPARTFELPR